MTPVWLLVGALQAAGCGASWMDEERLLELIGGAQSTEDTDVRLDCLNEAEVRIRLVTKRSADQTTVDLRDTPASLRLRTVALVIAELLRRPASPPAPPPMPTAQTSTQAASGRVLQTEKRFSVKGRAAYLNFVSPRTELWGGEVAAAWAPASLGAGLSFALLFGLEAATGSASGSDLGDVNFGLAGSAVAPAIQWTVDDWTTTVAVVGAAGVAWVRGVSDRALVQTDADAALWLRVGGHVGLEWRFIDPVALSAAAGVGGLFGGLRARSGTERVAQLHGLYVRAAIGVSLAL